MRTGQNHRQRPSSRVTPDLTARVRASGARSLYAQFEAIAVANPESNAVVSRVGVLSYAQLQARALRVAAELGTHGLVVGECVGVALPTSPERIAALLGIVAAGAAYLPLDPAYPLARREYMLANAGARLVLTDDPIIGLPSGVQRLSTDQVSRNSAECVLPKIGPDALAYVPFTSGSSGTPKGVEISHRAILGLTRHNPFMRLDGATRMLHAAPLGFDASTLEIWGPLLNGGSVVLHDEAVPTAGGLERTIATCAVTSAWLTSALFNAIVDENPLTLRGLRELLIGGEVLSPAHVRRAQAALPGLQLINGYGPTECTTFTTTYRIPRDGTELRSIPIGTPIVGRQLYIVDSKGELVLDDAAGELLVGGEGIACGYLRQPALTAEKFVVNPFVPGERVYRTGDLVRRRSDGVVEFLGRIDDQVKVRGFRIETAEIELALARLDALQACAVIAREDVPGDRRLVAYYVAQADPGAAALRAALAQALPEFMLPQAFVRVPKLPMTVHGKLDRRALPPPSHQRPLLAVTYQPPVSRSEQRLCAIFAEVLALDSVGRHDGFFELGGDSLRALRVLSRWNAESSQTLAATQFFQHPTPAALAKALEGTLPLPATPRHRPLPSNAEPIAIIAMAGRFPGANDIEGFWRNLCEGRDTVTHFEDAALDASIPANVRADPNYVRARGVIEGVELFDAGFFGISPREAELMDPQQRVFLELCWECLERGGYEPDAQPRPVGVFAGMYNASYFMRHVQHHPERIANVGEFQVMLGNEKDYIATRVAYKLDLKGPAISVHTACSTSLVAVAQAFDSLRNGSCDMALAGGVSITCPPRSGYRYQEASMLSPDGRTRSFDADAQGTVFSDGAGVVLLKRLSDALADGDQIHALIRGAAVNNDGAAKASFSAPSSVQQAAVIVAALDVAGVDARSISYVETHGTATPLGDPIEIEGLRQAFAASVDAESTPWCAIGSVKSNLGHLVIAAGVTGLIKTALALRERKIPASLYYRQANPALDLERSPFVVNAHLADWAGPSPRRAGVSSFGVGGTNAHVIVEEAPAPSFAGAERTCPPATALSLLTVSARTPAALRVAICQLAAHLEGAPDQALADIAHTLIVGRKAFALRAAVVACDQQRAAIALRALDLAKLSEPAGAADVVFMFPGQGAQYAGMGRALHAREPAFREAFDRCALIASQEMGIDLAARVFADDPTALAQTAITQPAIFAIEYALSQWWQSIGVLPVALIGHSIGEYVAAALAGVMTLESAVRLVVRRAALMQAQPAGAMLSVKLDAASLRVLLPDGVALAAENGPRACVASGRSELIETLQAQLEREGIASRRLQTSHAFHSQMLDAVLPLFRDEVARVTLSPPAIPIISTVTGLVLTDAQASSAGYWVRQLREEVRFSPALQSLLDAPRRVLLEVGPRTTLTTFARQHRFAGVSAMATLADSVDSEPEALLCAVGALWRRGAQVRREALDQRARRLRVELPTYPFERQRFWVDAPAAAGAIVSVEAPPIAAQLGAIAAPATHSEPAIGMVSADRQAHVPRLAKLFDEVAGVDIGEADRSTPFIELGLDSLTLTQVALQVSRQFAVKISFRQLMDTWESFDALTAMLAATTPAAAPEAIARPSAANLLSVQSVNASETPLQQLLAQAQILQQQLRALAATGSPSLEPFPCFFTSTHTPANFDAILEALKDSIVAMQQADGLPRGQVASKFAFDASKPPIQGARLGRDPEGKPGWFVPHPDTPGKYLKVAQ